MRAWSTSAPCSRSMPLAPLGQQRGEAAGLLAQRLGAHEVVADVVAAERGEAGLGAEHVGVERRQPGPERAVLLAEVAPGRGVVVEARLQPAELEAGHVDPEVGQLLDQRAVAAGRVGLALEGPELAAHLAEQVLEPGEVALGGRQAALGLLLAAAVLQDAGRLLDDEPPLLGPGVEHGVDLALRDDHVLLAADAACRTGAPGCRAAGTGRR